jgi:hypothetical protein
MMTNLEMRAISDTDVDEERINSNLKNMLHALSLLINMKLPNHTAKQ